MVIHYSTALVLRGDGYYEAVIQDPEGNLIELTTTLDEEHKK